MVRVPVGKHACSEEVRNILATCVIFQSTQITPDADEKQGLIRPFRNPRTCTLFFALFGRPENDARSVADRFSIRSTSFHVITTCLRNRSKNSQVEIPLEAAELRRPEVGGEDPFGKELAVRDEEGPAGRAPRDEGLVGGGGGSDGGGRRLCDEERCLCGSVHVTSGTGNNGQLLLLPLLVLLFVACRFHLEHLVEAAGKLLGNPSLAHLGEAGGGSEADGGVFGLHLSSCLLRYFMAVTQRQTVQRRASSSKSTV